MASCSLHYRSLPFDFSLLKLKTFLKSESIMFESLDRLDITDLEETSMKKVSVRDRGAKRGEKGELTGFGWESGRDYLPVRNGKSGPAADCP